MIENWPFYFKAHFGNSIFTVILSYCMDGLADNVAKIMCELPCSRSQRVVVIMDGEIASRNSKKLPCEGA